MILHALTVGRLSTNCYLVGCERTREAIVVDPGGDAPDILAAIQELGLHVGLIVLTHYHFDHLLAVPGVRAATGAPLAIHELEEALVQDPPPLFRLYAPEMPEEGVRPDRLLRAGEVLSVGDLRGTVLHTPGHSPGGISLWFEAERLVLTGDALFREGVGRTDFAGSSHEALVRAIRDTLFALPDDTRVYPGHGPPSTIGHERAHNPWVRG